MSRILNAIAIIIGLGSSAAQVGCLPEPPNAGLDEPTASVLEELTSQNRLSMNRLSMNRLSLNGLSSSKLSSNGLSLSSTKLIKTPEGRDLLTYVVRCALPFGQSLTGSYNGVTYVFKGNVGIAVEWLSGPLSPSGQRWMTACLLAHVNGYGIEVPISLRGEHPELVTTPDETQVFHVQEAAFYGNIFVKDESGTFDSSEGLYVCAGSTVQAQCSGSAISYVPKRSCGAGDDCELSFIGPCRNEAAPQAQACESAGEAFVEDCFPQAMGAQGWPGTLTKYPEVITVYLKASDYNLLYPGCLPLP